MIRRIACATLLACTAALAQTPAAPTAPLQPRTITLVRHGHYSADPAADERLGPGLSTLGIAQARLLAARLAAVPGGFDHVVSSPLTRARATAAVIAEQLHIATVPQVAELEECTPPTWREAVVAGESAESMQACAAQLDRLFAERFVPATGQPSDDLLVCHGNVIRYLVTRALRVDSKSWLEMSVGHASITRIRVEADGSFKVISLGDVGHLPGNLLSGASGDGEPLLATPPLR